jgi:protein-S-isoprenylcysteine O-methyltransferase Ste14
MENNESYGHCEAGSGKKWVGTIIVLIGFFILTSLTPISKSVEISAFFQLGVIVLSIIIIVRIWKKKKEVKQE